MQRARYFLLGILLLLLATTAVACQQPTPTPNPTATNIPPTATPTDIPPTATPAPQIIGGVNENATVNPRLISYSPAGGQEAQPDTAFEFLFDQPMNRDETAAALRVVDAAGEPVAGEVSWPEADARLMRFAPSGKLEPSSRYTAVLDETATSANGDPLVEALSIPFQTIGDLQVSQVAPADGVGEVQLDTAVTVIFNRPVVPLLINQEQADLPSPIQISPETDGSGTWVNTSVYVWRPTGGQLVDRTTYTVRVLADVVNEASASGAQLPSDYQWQFTTTAPTINYLELPGKTTSPRDGYEHLPLDQDFAVVFNQPMNTAVTEAAITLTSGNGNVPLEFSWNDTQTTVTFTPTQLLDLETRYLLTVANSAQSSNGGTIAQSLTWTATTVLYPAIVSTNPADGTTQEEFSSIFRIRFASPMSRNALNGKVTFDPAIAGDTDGFYDSWDWSVRYFGLEPSTTYTVTIAPGMADPYGNQITDETVVRFTTAPYSPSARLRMVNPFALYRTGGNNNMWVSYRNATQLDGALYALTTAEFMGFASRYGNSSPLDYVPASGQLIWQQSVDVSSQINVRDYHNFVLANEDGSELTPGFYFVTLNSPNVAYESNNLDARPIMLANANLTLKTTTTEALIWVTDLNSGQPLANVPVVLYDDDFNEVFRATTDADGLVYEDGLTLSPDWDNKYYALTEDPTVFGAAVNDWEEGTNPYDFGVYTDYYLQPGEGTVYFYTDRPIYRPGQTVHFKGIVRENDDLNFSLPEGRSVNVRINSYDGLVASEQFDLNEFSTFVGQIELDSEATLGNYWVEIQFGDRYIGSGSFDVAEYRKPTFQVNATADNEEVLVGGSIQTTAVAEFFSGGAVANSDIRWYATSQPYIFNPGGNLAPYSFYNDDRDTGNRGYGYSYEDFLAEGEGTTNASGTYSWQLPAELASNSSGSRQYRLEATVTDIANNVVSGRTNVIVHAAEVYPGVKPSGSRLGEAGEETSFDLILVDWNGDIVPNGTIDVEIV
ncbi:MAG: Ig-like domain-containing protein, partial [Anaerolineales bacterium]|nr:Ig-like domain-containing protein [Anaerolineales bacterium]